MVVCQKTKPNQTIVCWKLNSLVHIPWECVGQSENFLADARTTIGIIFFTPFFFFYPGVFFFLLFSHFPLLFFLISFHPSIFFSCPVGRAFIPPITMSQSSKLTHTSRELALTALICCWLWRGHLLSSKGRFWASFGWASVHRRHFCPFCIALDLAVQF